MARIQDITPAYTQFAESAAPATPATGVVRIYAKSDGLLYSKDDAGAEKLLSGATAAGVSIADSGNHFTATDVEGALSELFTSVSDGKTLVAAAITGKGVATAGTDSFATMATNIGNIITGGSTGDYRVRFIDYDGTILQDTWVNSGASVSPPANPSHTGLTFQAWNHSTLSSVTRDYDVGATYTTSDGKTKLVITVTSYSGLSVTLYFNKSDDSTLTVDWGDSSSNTYTNSGNFNTGAHAYSAAGTYNITLSITTGSGTYTFGNGSSTYPLTTAPITAAYIGSNVTSIGNYGFYNCAHLSEVSIPSAVTVVGSYAFQGTYIKHITIPSSVTLLKEYCLYSCSALETVSLPSGITTVGSRALSYSPKITSFIVPNSTTTIETYAFEACYGLKTINIPSGLTSLGAYAFRYCYALEEIVIPSGITTFGTQTLNTCSALRKITLPSTFATIGASMGSCTNMRQYIINATTPPTLSNATYITVKGFTKIYVPDVAVSTYKSATNWSTYADYIYSINTL